MIEKRSADCIALGEETRLYHRTGSAISSSFHSYIRNCFLKHTCIWYLNIFFLNNKELSLKTPSRYDCAEVWATNFFTAFRFKLTSSSNSVGFLLIPKLSWTHFMVSLWLFWKEHCMNGEKRRTLERTCGQYTANRGNVRTEYVVVLSMGECSSQ